MIRVLFAILCTSLMVVPTSLGSLAVFADPETTGLNAFSSGTIAISVNGEDPWQTPVEVADLTPSAVRQASYNVRNVGSNPVDLCKNIASTTHLGGFFSPLEETNPGAAANCGVAAADLEGDGFDDCPLAGFIGYYLTSAISIDNSPAGDSSASCAIALADGLTVATVQNGLIYLGVLGPGDEMTVVQSSELAAITGQWAIGDVLAMSVDYRGDQTNSLAPPGQLTGLPGCPPKS